MSGAMSSIPNTGLPQPKWRWLLYVAGFLLVQISVLIAVWFITTTPWFLTHDAYPGMKQSGYSLRLKHADCDVVLYGDSSALTGLDPEIVEKITGLKACNVAEGVTIQGVVGSRFPLDSYLANNKRPRYLLAMYTPSLFRPYVAPFTEYQPEGMLYAMQYDRGNGFYHALAHRSDWALKFDLWAGRQMIQYFLETIHLRSQAGKATDPRAQRAARRGIWPYPLPPEDHCVRTAYHIDPSSIERHEQSVAKMRSLYGGNGTTVLINIAPIPTCDVLQQTYRVKSEGLHDNPFETLPISDFNEGDVHFSPEGGRIVSTEAAQQILALEEGSRGAQAAQGKTAEEER